MICLWAINSIIFSNTLPSSLIKVMGPSDLGSYRSLSGDLRIFFYWPIFSALGSYLKLKQAWYILRRLSFIWEKNGPDLAQQPCIALCAWLLLSVHPSLWSLVIRCACVVVCIIQIRLILWHELNDDLQEDRLLEIINKLTMLLKSDTAIYSSDRHIHVVHFSFVSW